jgi:putative FmdB family regulatory protein
MDAAMPIFEYICRSCDRAFETLVTAGRQPSCGSCRSQDLAKQLSVFAVNAKPVSSAPAAGSCGACGDPRGPGACSMN